MLPTLIERSKALLAEHGEPEPEEALAPRGHRPRLLQLPPRGQDALAELRAVRRLVLGDGRSAAADYPRLAAAGVVSLFGSINVAMPFLLDFARVPADTFQLFLATGVLNSRFGTLAAAMHMVVLALVGTYALERPAAPLGAARCCATCS